MQVTGFGDKVAFIWSVASRIVLGNSLIFT